jgi:hypothetical protein
MSDPKTTDRVAPRASDIADAAALYKLLSNIKRWGALGTLVLGLLAGGNLVVNRQAPTKEEIEATIKAAVSAEVQRAVGEAVRREVDPLKADLVRLQLAVEYERRERERNK